MDRSRPVTCRNTQITYDLLLNTFFFRKFMAWIFPIYFLYVYYFPLFLSWVSIFTLSHFHSRFWYKTRSIIGWDFNWSLLETPDRDLSWRAVFSFKPSLVARTSLLQNKVFLMDINVLWDKINFAIVNLVIKKSNFTYESKYRDTRTTHMYRSNSNLTVFDNNNHF